MELAYSKIKSKYGGKVFLGGIAPEFPLYRNDLIVWVFFFSEDKRVDEYLHVNRNRSIQGQCS